MEPYFTGPYRVEMTDRVSRKGLPIWRLLEPLTLMCEIGGHARSFTTPAGYLTDGASVPAWAWRLIPPGTRAAASAAIHDYLYEHRIREAEIGQGQARYDADLAFREALNAAGVVPWRRCTMYRSVRALGWRGWGKAAGA